MGKNASKKVFTNWGLRALPDILHPRPKPTPASFRLVSSPRHQEAFRRPVYNL